MATKEKIAELRGAAEGLELYGVAKLARYTDAELAAIYSGAGPDYLPKWSRVKLSNCLSEFEPAFLIHDVEFEESDGMHKAFNEANTNLLYNCRLFADFWHPWYSWRRYKMRFLAQAVFEACDSDLGWLAWRLAYEKSQTQTTKESK